jgi:hypothetical protein
MNMGKFLISLFHFLYAFKGGLNYNYYLEISKKFCNNYSSLFLVELGCPKKFEVKTS